MSYRSQAIASVVLGTPLTFAVAGLYAELGPANPATNHVTAIFLLLPVWCAVMVWGLWPHGARRTWLSLGAALILAVAAILLCRYALKA